MLFLPLSHAVTGCDSTPSVSGIGKPTALKVLQNNKQFRDIASAFIKSETPDDYKTFGEATL